MPASTARWAYLYKEGVVLVEHLLSNHLEPLSPHASAHTALTVKLHVELALEEVTTANEQRRATFLHHSAPRYDNHDILFLKVGLLPHQLRAEPREKLVEAKKLHEVSNLPFWPGTDRQQGKPYTTRSGACLSMFSRMKSKEPTRSWGK